MMSIATAFIIGIIGGIIGGMIITLIVLNENEEYEDEDDL